MKDHQKKAIGMPGLWFLLSAIRNSKCDNYVLQWQVEFYDELSCLLKDSEPFILFAENSQILLKISVIPILLTFIYLVALNLLVNNQLNSSL